MNLRDHIFFYVFFENTFLLEFYHIYFENGNSIGTFPINLPLISPNIILYEKKMGRFDEIYICENSGIILFNYPQSGSLDIDLFGALLSALNACAYESIRKDLDEFRAGGVRYRFYREPDKNFFIVAKVGLEELPAEIDAKLKEIMNSFYGFYGKLVENFNGNVSEFENFRAFCETNPQLANAI